MSSVNEIRETFLSYFEKHGHARLASSPLVPENDPTLLFVNAGMVPFKTWFTGETRPSVPRATTSQKCVRAGGKHNDLDNVGYTARHHTFFEMLGNFSFGDYFKAAAIEHAWTLVTKEFGLSAEKLLVTVYSEDEEAALLWRKIAGLPDERIIRIATSDNFWSMGDTGPCGPCSEIFYDHGPDVPGGPPGSPDEDGDRFIEIWNLVFMQFDQLADGSRGTLPKPSIDTGMGLERIAAVLQSKHNNYDIDLFQALIGAEEEVFSARAEGDLLPSFRVIADHLRTSAFLISDGVTPSNEGRGYVLRRIMRRGMRHAHLLGAREPSLFKLTDTLIAEMGAAYPELGRARAAISATLEQEEARFQRTLGRGLTLLEDAVAELGTGEALPGETAFKLYDTYGFPADLTADILRGQGRELDQAGFDAAMARQKDTAKASWQGSGDSGGQQVWFDLANAEDVTEFLGYKTLVRKSEPLLAIVTEAGEIADSANVGETVDLVFARTPFYAESGGQAGDHGNISARAVRARVTNVVKRAGLHVHRTEILEGTLKPGARLTLEVDGERRRQVKANHSATHLLHAALRNILGEHVTQKGSLVDADRLRFDFSHGAPLTEAELEAIESEVNAVIRQNAPTRISVTSPEKAIEAGALALFGEKYGDTVRVLEMGQGVDDQKRPYSVELCGGTHVSRTGDIAVFTILSEGGVSAGVRRIEAATGAEALSHLKAEAQVARDLASDLRVPLREVGSKVTRLQDERRKLENELAAARKELAMGGGGVASGPELIDGIAFLGRVAHDVAPKDLRGLIDEAKTQMGSGIAVFIAVNEGKAAVAVGVTSDLTERHSAVDLVKLASAVLGGKGGGGRPDMAQAGGPEADKAEVALETVRKAIAKTA
jgi:alanyl-tRNA synthetase